MSSLTPRKEAWEVAMGKKRGEGKERETVETQREGRKERDAKILEMQRPSPRNQQLEGN